MTKQQFIEKVLIVLNDANSGVFDGDMIGSDMVQINNYIEQQYPSAWRKAVNLLPKHYFAQKAESPPTPTGGVRVEADLPDGTGYIVLPNDYFRLVNLKMQGWEAACGEAVPENDLINAVQNNQYTRGNFKRPVCVLRKTLVSPPAPEGGDSELKDVIYYYSLKRGLDEHKIELFTYIPLVTELAAEVDVADNAIEILAHITAAEVLTTQEKFDVAKEVGQKYMQML